MAERKIQGLGKPFSNLVWGNTAGNLGIRLLFLGDWSTHCPIQERHG